jgi:hypothetical protein
LSHRHWDGRFRHRIAMFDPARTAKQRQVPAGRRPCTQVNKPQTHVLPHWLPSSRGVPRRGSEPEQFSTCLAIRRLPIARTWRWLDDLWLRAWDLRNIPPVAMKYSIGANGGHDARTYSNGWL